MSDAAETELEELAATLKPLLEPKSVALIGASRNEKSIGGAILSNLIGQEFTGRIYPVNPKAKELQGREVKASVLDIDGPLDLAIIAVPSVHVPQVFDQCLQKKVPALVIISAGFGEVSEEGRAVERDMVEKARANGMRILGPNCMGFLNTNPSVQINASFAPLKPPRGGIGFLSQSGALGIAVLDYAASHNLGISSFLSVGNKSDISSNDMISYWANDPRTKVIALYLESFGNPHRFSRIAPQVARKKPIVAVKSGRSAAGSRAAASHTASLATLDVAVDALFEQAGVIRTETLEGLFDVVSLLESQPYPKGKRVAVITNAGGPGILLADALEGHGFELPVIDDATATKLREFLPAEGSVGNPIDMIASASPEDYAKTIEVIGKFVDVDTVIVLYVPPLVTEPESVAEAIARSAVHIPTDVPLLSVFLSSKGAPEILSRGPRGSIPSYSFPENAARALAAARKYGKWRDRERGQAHVISDGNQKRIREIVESRLEKIQESTWLAPEEVFELFSLAGIPVADFRVSSQAQLVESASQIGYPLVLKAVAPNLVHKTDVGGVATGIDSEESLLSAVNQMSSKLAQKGVNAERYLLQTQVEGEVEVFVGATFDHTFGPLVVCGLGGIHVEVLKDVAFCLPPVTDIDAAEMLGKLRGKALFEGVRGSEGVDREALIELLCCFSSLIALVPEITECEINPVLATRESVIAVDGRARIQRK